MYVCVCGCLSCCCFLDTVTRVPPKIKTPSIPLAPASLSPQTTHVPQLLELSNMLTYCTYTPCIFIYMHNKVKVLLCFPLFKELCHRSLSSGFFGSSVCKVIRLLSSQVQHVTVRSIHHCTCPFIISNEVCTFVTLNVLHSRSAVCPCDSLHTQGQHTHIIHTCYLP